MVYNGTDFIFVPPTRKKEGKERRSSHSQRSAAEPIPISSHSTPDLAGCAKSEDCDSAPTLLRDIQSWPYPGHWACTRRLWRRGLIPFWLRFANLTRKQLPWRRRPTSNRLHPLRDRPGDAPRQGKPVHHPRVWLPLTEQRCEREVFDSIAGHVNRQLSTGPVSLRSYARTRRGDRRVESSHFAASGKVGGRSCVLCLHSTMYCSGRTGAAQRRSRPLGH